eukprot:gene9769-10768_t
MRTSTDNNEEFPATLEGFGYHFNNAGQLRDIKLDIPFRFEVVQGDQTYNQDHYEALGKAIEEHIYFLLEEDEELEKVPIPLDAVGQEPRSCIFKSKDMDKMEKLLILIHGSGVVRAGQWSRSLIINHSLETGSQIPYIKKAKEEGYGVIVLNTNQNVDLLTGKGPVRGSENPSDHFLYVWDKVVMPSEAKHIAIMAHSYGGIVVLDGLKQRPGEMMERVFAIAMSDSVHPVQTLHQLRRVLSDWFCENARNWISSSLPLNSPVDLSNQGDARRVSAGTKRHVETSWYAFKSVFNFFEKRLKKSLEKAREVEAAAVAAEIEAAEAARIEAAVAAKNDASDGGVDGGVGAGNVEEVNPNRSPVKTEFFESEMVEKVSNVDHSFVNMSTEENEKKLPVEHEEETIPGSIDDDVDMKFEDKEAEKDQDEPGTPIAEVDEKEEL